MTVLWVATGYACRLARTFKENPGITNFAAKLVVDPVPLFRMCAAACFLTLMFVLQCLNQICFVLLREIGDECTHKCLNHNIKTGPEAE